jgi:mannose-6-phosphate isomerase-like protein (cupin superfamily)
MANEKWNWQMENENTEQSLLDCLSPRSAHIVLPCPNLGEALDFFTGRLGFRIEMIMPADSPRTAVISGHGVTLRLEAETDTTPAPVVFLPDGAQEFIVSHIGANNAWNEGRVGMQYRDLIPGRLGGRFIASHIRIRDGGETPDYVHYHKVRFQMIYCKEGWARVVYEDQGQPFILQAGDCVLQPPEIRHRVLETSAGLEVIEIACPAVHETHVDHDLQLPTPRILSGRLYNNQRFVIDRASEAKWAPWIPDGFAARDTGIAAATNGLAAARVVRATANHLMMNNTSNGVDIRHAGEFFFLFVLKGELILDSIEYGSQLREGDSCVLPAHLKYRLRASADLEMLEVRLPAEGRETFL